MSESILDKAENLLINTFKTKESAVKAYNLLLEKGYSKEDIYLVMSDDTRNKYFKDAELPEHTLEEDVEDGSKAGSIIGGSIGAIAAAVMTVGTSMIVPGVGLVIAGPLMAAVAGVAGAGAGAAAGGMVGALVGGGVHEAKAHEYEAAVKAGEILVGIKAKSEDAYNELKKAWDSL